MSFTYPLSLPAAMKFAKVRFSPRAVVAVSESPYTLSQQVQAHQGQALAFDVSLPAMERADAEDCVAFLLKLNGREGTFLFGDPANTSPRGTIAGTVVADSAGSPTQNAARDSRLYLRGLTAGTTLKAGDWIQIGSGSSSRLHKCVTDATASAGGLMGVDIWPFLREAVTDATAITTTSAKGLFRMASNITQWDIGEAQIYGIDFSAVEAL